MLKYSQLFVLGCFSLFMSCSNDDDTSPEKDNEDQQEFMLTIMSPEEGQEYGHEDEVHIQAEATSDQTLHGYEIIAVVDGEEMLLHDSHEHENTLDIHHHWTPEFEEPKNVTLIIRIYQSHEGYESEQEVGISFH